MNADRETTAAILVFEIKRDRWGEARHVCGNIGMYLHMLTGYRFSESVFNTAFDDLQHHVLAVEALRSQPRHEVRANRPHGIPVFSAHFQALLSQHGLPNEAS